MHCLQTAPYQTVLLGNTGIREKIGLFIGFQPKWLKWHNTININVTGISGTR